MAKDITTKAILVSVSFSGKDFTKFDEAWTAEATDAKGASREAGRMNKRLINKEALAEMKSIAGAARAYIKSKTFPWLYDGVNILPVSIHNEVDAQIKKYIYDYEEATERFLDKYDGFVEQARIDLNGAFNPADYPSMSKLRNAFSASITYQPIPSAGDFRITMEQSELKRLEDMLSNQMISVTKTAEAELWERLTDKVKKLIERLNEYKNNPKAILRDSLIDNIIIVSEEVKAMNITDNPQINRMANVLAERLGEIDPEDLRGNADVRVNALETAEKMLERLEGYSF